MNNVEATSRNVENVAEMFKNAGNEGSPMSGEELKRTIINYVKDYEEGDRARSLRASIDHEEGNRI